MPIAKSPPPMPVCTPAQVEQNRVYCNQEPFNVTVCELDGGIYCPERCGVCAEAIADPDTSTTVQWTTKIATEVHLFDQEAYRNRLSAALGISRNRVRLQVKAGSVDVESTIVTPGGSQQEATELVQIIVETFTSTKVASVLLDVVVDSFDLPKTISASPSLPPLPRAPPTSPSPNKPPPSSPTSLEKPEMSGGAIAGIVLLAFIASAVIVWLFVAKQKNVNRKYIVVEKLNPGSSKSTARLSKLLAFDL